MTDRRSAELVSASTSCYRVATLADIDGRPDLAAVYRTLGDLLTDRPTITAPALASALIEEIGVTG